MIKEKVAIIGNSFGFSKNDKYNSHIGPSWVELLMQDKKYHVVNFSELDASVWYCYQVFLKNYKDFSKIIFLVSSPGGMMIDSQVFLKDLDYEYKHWTYNKVVQFRNSNKDTISYRHFKIIDALHNYYNYIQNYEYDKYAQALLLNNILSLSHNVTLVPCYEDSFDNSTTISLSDISNKEIQRFFHQESLDKCLDKIKTLNLIDCRKCLMTEENNYIFYTKILSAFQSNKIELISSEFNKTVNEFTKYWKNT